MYNPQLETFIKVVDAGSFNKAAEQIFITPTAVIKQINLLEVSLNVQLFIRTHRGLKLTLAGESLYNDAKYIIQYCKDSVLRAQSTMIEQENIIRIGASPTTPAQVLVELWPKIHEFCPTIKFQIVPFENTPENAREILKNLGQNIDVIAGIFDHRMLEVRNCSGVEISREPLCCAMSIHHPLAKKDKLKIEDLYGESLLMMHSGWSTYVDQLRDDLQKNHEKINIQDIDFYNVNVFNRCENGNEILLAVQKWKMIHPLLKILPVQWEHTIPYGFLHSPTPSAVVKQFLEAIGLVLANQKNHL